MNDMIFTRDVERKNVSLRLRKTYKGADISSHTVLTDDVFSYVDFYFKKHKKVIKDKNGKSVEPKYLFYWDQAKNFYKAAKLLPIESSPLPMYYCVLNAVKAYLFYNAKNYEEIENDFKGHGLKEGNADGDNHLYQLDNIYVCRDGWGVFYKFAKTIEPNFELYWKKGKTEAISIKNLMYQLPFIHSAYISTYSLPRKNEKFIPLSPNAAPIYRYAKDNKIRLVVDLDRSYFKQNAVCIPEEIKKDIPNIFVINPENEFQLVSSNSFKKKELNDVTDEYRKFFSYISADKRIWYLKKNKINDEFDNINSMILEFAIIHRFSEIVRYKPEQMAMLLSGKENWLVHEFLSLALDQFMDEISCEITKQEIMPTRIK